MTPPSKGKRLGQWVDAQEAQTVELYLNSTGLYQLYANDTLCAEGLTPISVICAAEFTALRDHRKPLLELLRYIKSEDEQFIFCIDAHQRTTSTSR